MRTSRWAEAPAGLAITWRCQQLTTPAAATAGCCCSGGRLTVLLASGVLRLLQAAVINQAYDVLKRPLRRAHYIVSPFMCTAT
jgi:hypothetical protein